MVIIDVSKLAPILIPLLDIFEKYSFKNEIRIVGGAVRDLLCGKIPKDLDFATTLTPEQMKVMFNKENIRMINTNGEKHGTVTVRIKKNNYEITTLRRDDVTDGRHAEVSFTTDWEVDAERRDLTVNAMYLDFSGHLYDYFNGAEDLKKRRIVFVGEPNTRIKEDYLRILRYFRFYGKLAEKPFVHDTNTIKAICDNAKGLDQISGERIWSEFHKILAGNFAKEIVEVMLKQCNLGQRIGLPNFATLDWNSFNEIHIHRNKYDFQPITFIAVLLKNETQVQEFQNRVKLSNADRYLASFIVKHKNDELPHDDMLCLKYFQKMAFKGRNSEVIRCHIAELLKVLNMEKLLREFEQWEKPVFHINGNTLKSKGVVGKKIKDVLDELINIWIDNNFILNDYLVDKIIEKNRNDIVL